MSCDKNLHVSQASKPLEAEAGTWTEPDLGEVGSLSARLLNWLHWLVSGMKVDWTPAWSAAPQRTGWAPFRGRRRCRRGRIEYWISNWIKLHCSTCRGRRRCRRGKGRPRDSASLAPASSPCHCSPSLDSSSIYGKITLAIYHCLKL